MDLEQFRSAGYDAVDRIYKYYKTLKENPESIPVQADVKPGYLRDAISDTPPNSGDSFERIQDEFRDVVLPGLNHWQHPSSFHYFPSNTTFESMLSEMMISSINNPGFSWDSNPCSELELKMADWLAGLFGLSDAFHHSYRAGTGGGVIQPSSSESILVAVIAARERYLRMNNTRDQSKLVMYASTQTHSSATKAARVLNLQIRLLDVDEELSLTNSSLLQAIEEDRKRGLIPFIVIATIGTTSTGAVDKIHSLGKAANEYGLWMHIDAAWAGTHLAVPELRGELELDAVNECADSINIGMHKMGLVSMSTVILFVRDLKPVTDALTITPEYLRNKATDSGQVLDFKDCGIGLGRHFSSPKIFYMLKSYGADGFREHIRKSIRLGEVFRRLIEADDSFEVVYKPRMSLTVFRLKRGDGKEDQLNELNKLFYANLVAHKDKVSLTHTVVNGKYCVRFVCGCPQTEEKHVLAAYELVKSVAESTLKE